MNDWNTEALIDAGLVSPKLRRGFMGGEITQESGAHD
jgi:hypothetical protein